MSPSCVKRRKRRRILNLAGVIAILAFVTLAGQAGADLPAPEATRQVDIEEQAGQTVPTYLEFKDQSGKQMKLAELFQDGKPVLLVFAYFRCPMLCGLVLRGVVNGLSDLGWKPGEEYRAVTVSFDPKDTTAAALRKQQSILGALETPEAHSAWPFLVGAEPEIQALTGSVGFRYAYDAATDQYAHPSAVVILTPDGKISRYLYGIDFPASDLRLALIEAGEGRVGTILDRVIMTCYRYDPVTRRYGPYVFGFLRIGSAFFFAVLAVTVIVLCRRERARRAES